MRRQEAESILAPLRAPVAQPPQEVEETEEEEEEEEEVKAPVKPAPKQVKRLAVVVPQLPQQALRTAKDDAGNVYEYFTIEEALAEILDFVRSSKR